MTELVLGPGGIVLATECVTLVDTRSMPWEPWTGTLGDRIKRLVTGSDDQALVYLAWFAPRSGDDPPSRTFNRTVREFRLSSPVSSRPGNMSRPPSSTGI